MQLLYTTSVGQDEPQTKPSISLGGFKSSTAPNNDELGNLFDEISPLTLQNGKTEYVAIMLENTLGITATSVEIWVEPQQIDSYSKYLIAPIIPNQNADGDWVMERTRTKTAKPFTGDFEESSDTSRISLGDVDNGNVIGLWIARELLIDFAKEDQCSVYEEDPDNPRRYISIEKAQLDQMNIKISWS